MLNEPMRLYSECFFGYSIKLVKDTLGIREKKGLWPRIYLDRINSKLTVYMTFPNWYQPLTPVNEINPKVLLYDKAKIIFDASGVSVNQIVKKGNEGNTTLDINEEISYSSDCIKNRGRFECSALGKDLSGVGAIVLKKGDLEAIFYIAINYAPKKKIYYRILNNKIVFKTKAPIKRLKIKVLHDPHRLLCLANDGSDKESVEIIFKNGTASIPKANDDERYYVDLGGSGEEYRRNALNYLLICDENKTTPKSKKPNINLDRSYLCPYCHNPVKYKSLRYHKGMYCDGSKINDLLIIDRNKKRQKGFIMCKGAEAGNIEDPMRNESKKLLPPYINNVKNHNIAVIGKARCGKTTYISRLLNITKSNIGVNVDLAKLDFFRKYNISYAPAMLLTKSGVDKKKKLQQYQINSIPFYSGEKATASDQNFINKYTISIPDRKFVDPTIRDDSTVYKPFILELGKHKPKAYLNIYDIAGEDVIHDSDSFKLVTRDKNLSLILLMDLSSMNDSKEIDSRVIDDNKGILEQIKKIITDSKEKRLNKTISIAIVLTKFDRFEKRFSLNASCLRGDLNELYSSELEESSLMSQIDASSDEIESFLISNGIDIRSDYLKDLNIKFFGLSSFSYNEAIYHTENVVKGRNELEDDKVIETNIQQFECAAKRVELPLAWILHELGEI